MKTFTVALLFFLVATCAFINKPMLGKFVAPFLQPWQDRLAARGSEEHHLHHKCKRDVMENPCPSVVSARLSAMYVPSFKIEQYCKMDDGSKTCSTCSEQKSTNNLKPRLKFLGYIVENGTEKHYFQEQTYEMKSIACLCDS